MSTSGYNGSMKKLLLMAAQLALLSSLSAECLGICNHAPDFSGRLGDQIMMYVKSKWIAKERNAPFYFVPFDYSDRFYLDLNEHKIPAAILREGARFQSFPDGDMITNVPELDESLTNTYYFCRPYELDEIYHWSAMLRDQEFMEEIRQNLTPKEKITPIEIPDGMVGVALHIRKGGGYDNKILSIQYYEKAQYQFWNQTHRQLKGYADGYHPYKFLPNQYYIDQLRLLSKMLGHPPLYVYLFTDDMRPRKLAKSLQENLGLPNIQFDYRKGANHHTLNVVEDMRKMSQFDYLIRSRSHYPVIANLMGNPKIVFFPLEAVWHHIILAVEKVGVYVSTEAPLAPDFSFDENREGNISHYQYFLGSH